MKRLITSISLIVLVSTATHAQSKDQKSSLREDIPEFVINKLSEYFENEDLDKIILMYKVGKDRDGNPKYAFRIKNCKAEPDLSNIAISHDGQEILTRTYRYEKTGNLPLEVIISMQERCGSDEVKSMTYVVYSSGKEFYSASCGGKNYTIDQNFADVSKNNSLDDE